MIKVVSLFSNEYITYGKTYYASVTPTIIDPITYQPVPARYFIICDDEKGRYFIICDDEKGRIFECRNFITVAEWREKQIKTILDD